MVSRPQTNKKLDAIVQRYQSIALVLQGGGALGAYQAGVYEELANTGYEPDWVAGVSIGALNAALIVGNLPERRVERLLEFWHLISTGMGPFDKLALSTTACPPIETAANNSSTHNSGLRGLFNQFSAVCSATLGIPGFYTPRFPPAWLQPVGTPAALSFYDPSPLRTTLERLIDFDLINSRKIRLSVGAVNVRTGNSEYFDNFERLIGPEHIMASGALPPAFPPVTIDGEAYWDGGIVSNTPLQYVLDRRAKQSLLILQIDVFSARGKMPVDLPSVQQRQKDILYSSRTRYNSNMAEKVENTRKVICEVLRKLPPNLKEDASVQALIEILRTAPTDIVHLIYRQAPYEQESKDYEFSRLSVIEHWRAGLMDLRDTIAHPEWLSSSGLEEGVTQYDLTKHSRAI